jgi:hypothetical protein
VKLIAMRNDTYKYGKLFALLTLVWLAFGSFARGSHNNTSTAKLQELISIGGQDLPGIQGASEILAFDVSPDNQTIIVAFKITEEPHRVSISVGKWEIASKRFLAKAQLEEAANQDSEFARLLHTPDGLSLISQTSHAINVLDPSTLKLERTIPIASSWSVLSGDGHVLAVTVWSKGESSFHIFDLRSGELLGYWLKPKQFQYLANPSLSFHGDQMLLTAPGPAPDILLVDSFTGKVLRSFSSGFRYEPGHPSYGIGSAVFIDSSRFVVAPSRDSGKTGRYSGKTLRVFNANTGEILRELAYRHLAGQDPWVSPSGSLLALINAWRSPSQIFTDADVGIPIQLLLFRTDTPQPVCIVEELPMSGSTPEGATTAIKPSQDLSLLGFRINNRLTIYKITNCDFLHANHLGSESTGSRMH